MFTPYGSFAQLLFVSLSFDDDPSIATFETDDIAGIEAEAIPRFEASVFIIDRYIHIGALHFAIVSI
jgi:hypothetical protein